MCRLNVGPLDSPKLDRLLSCIKGWIVWVHPSDLKFKLQFSESESNFLNDYIRLYIFYAYRGVFIEHMTPSL